MTRRDDWPPGHRSPGALASLRVLDLSRILAGPFAAMLLADLGADVIKVEVPGSGDETRRWGPPFSADGTAAYFLSVNRNKRAITLDLATPDGAAAARRLAAAADVVIDNFLPGRLARFGLARQTLTAANPRLVTCTITGYGREGAYADRAGFDFLVQAEGGIMSITGDAGGEPTKVGVAIADLAAGLFATIGILAALHRRERTGRGGDVEVSLLDAQVGLLANQAMNWLVGGVEPGRLGNAHPNIAPYESYATADEPIAIGAGTDRQFARLTVALRHPGLADDPRFASNADRVHHRAELRAALEATLTTAPRAVWLERLNQVGVPAGPINTIPEVFADPVVRERMLTSAGGTPQVRAPIRIDGQPLPVDAAPPALGQHTDQVLRALGLDDHTLSRRRATGSV
jgi:crotonobetainyl-CoA:carnitine CoA-transferase CaiB-like acyl-CoA transferase